MNYRFSSAYSNHPSTIPMRWEVALPSNELARAHADMLATIGSDRDAWVAVEMSDGSTYTARHPGAA